MKWYQRCAFCTPPPDLVTRSRSHHPWCFWQDFMKASYRYYFTGVLVMPLARDEHVQGDSDG